MIVLIPAYEPKTRMITLIRELRSELDHVTIVIVDDGSPEQYRTLFSLAKDEGAIVLRHKRNLGKGEALKTGFKFIEINFSGESVVCTDCDGQHAAKDVARVAIEAARNESIVLGVRNFGRDVPLKSKFGNVLTSYIFYAATRLKLKDTQTGLRGFPAQMIAWLSTVHGSRFEYEQNQLLNAVKNGIAIKQIGIETIYFEDNSGTHFRPVIDSIRIYLPIVMFSLVSLASFVLDTLLLFLLNALTGSLAIAVFGARTFSSTFNFALNRNMVFKSQKKLSSTALQYWALVSTLSILNFTFMYTFTRIEINLLIAKILTEATIFIVSFGIQQKVIFKKTRALEPDHVDVNAVFATTGER